MPFEPSLYSKQVFQGMTYAGPLARRHPLIRAVDDLLDRYPNMSDFLKSLTAFKIVEYCDEYYTLVKKEGRASMRIAGVVLMRKRAVRKYGRLVRLARAQNNWRKLVHNPKFKKLAELQTKAHPDAKCLEDDILLEALDDLHRAGHGLKEIQKVWLKSNTRKNFWDYIDEYLSSNPTKKVYQVKYLDENERRSYQVRFVGGRIWRGIGDESQPFDTNECAVNSPRRENIRGWGIFVMGTDFRIYTGSCFSAPTFFEEGEEHAGLVNFWESGDVFHHSSFLGGRPVLCAGEWYVTGGALMCVSPRSGHYQPPVHLFKLFLTELQRRGIQLNHVAVAWPWPAYNDRKFYNARKFMMADDVVFLREPKLGGEALPQLDDMLDPNSDQPPVQPSLQSQAQPQGNGGPSDSYQNANYQSQGQGNGVGSSPQQRMPNLNPTSPNVKQPGRLNPSRMAPWNKG